MTTKYSVYSIELHAELANSIFINAIPEIINCGDVDFRDEWNWKMVDTGLLRGLVESMYQLKTTKIVGLPTSYNGCWIRKEVEINTSSLNGPVIGKLIVTRSGPGLENTTWNFIEKSR